MLLLTSASNYQNANHEFGPFPNQSYMIIKKAWVDKDMMQKWIDFIFIPWRNTEVPGIAWQANVLLHSIYNCISI